MTLDEWSTAVSVALDLEVDTTPLRDVVLDLARDTAHGIARPAAPLSTFLLGIAVGRGANPTQAAEAIRALIPTGPASASDAAPVG